MLRVEASALHEIDAALERIRSGTYGICEWSGAAISAERLHALPWTRFAADSMCRLASADAPLAEAHKGRRVESFGRTATRREPARIYGRQVTGGLGRASSAAAPKPGKPGRNFRRKRGAETAGLWLSHA